MTITERLAALPPFDDFDRALEIGALEARLALAVELLRDMASIAEFDSWHKASTGRQIIYADARAFLAHLDKERT